MPKATYQFSHTATEGVDRACEIAKQLIHNVRGHYDTEQQCVDAVARVAQLNPSVLRRFLQPSRRPKEVGLSVWTRLCAAYRRQLERQLHQLEDEIARLELCDSSDCSVDALLDEAKDLVCKIEAIASALPPSHSRK